MASEIARSLPDFEEDRLNKILLKFEFKFKLDWVSHFQYFD